MKADEKIVFSSAGGIHNKTDDWRVIYSENQGAFMCSKVVKGGLGNDS